MLYLKALHLIFVVTWFAGLFYSVRLFIYHSECQQLPEQEREVLSRHFKKAARNLWWGITWPSAMGVLIFGFWFLFEWFGTAIPNWMWLKIVLVTGLFVYHLLCDVIFRRLQKDHFVYSGFQLRIWNEVATLFLVAIIFIVVLKGQGNWLYGIFGLIGFSVLLMTAIRIYKRIRENKS